MMGLSRVGAPVVLIAPFVQSAESEPFTNFLLTASRSGSEMRIRAESFGCMFAPVQIPMNGCCQSRARSYTPGLPTYRAPFWRFLLAKIGQTALKRTTHHCAEVPLVPAVKSCFGSSVS